MERYHPRRKKNEIMGDEEKLALLARGKFVTLALCRGDEPYIVTLSYGLDREPMRLYFHCANKGDKLDFIAANGKACATLIKDNGYLHGRCDHDYESLVLRGTLRVVDELDEKKHGLLVLLKHLEEDPDPILARNIKDDASYGAVTIVRFDIDSIIGKKYVG